MSPSAGLLLPTERDHDSVRLLPGKGRIGVNTDSLAGFEAMRCDGARAKHTSAEDLARLSIERGERCLREQCNELVRDRAFREVGFERGVESAVSQAPLCRRLKPGEESVGSLWLKCRRGEEER